MIIKMENLILASILIVLILIAFIFQDLYRKYIIIVFGKQLDIFRNEFVNIACNEIYKHIKKTDKILDFGSGFGSFYNKLSMDGYNITALDISNDLFIGDKKNLVVYDGSKIPYSDNFFDVSLVSTVLHHVKPINEVLIELRRVSKNIIIIEDVPQSNFEFYTIGLLDSILNFEFLGHPHNNKTDKQWKETFTKYGMKLIFEKELSKILTSHLMHHKMYLLSTQ
jgi:ubiquinone/menaquinone biosynthesis C-methylase UbiE